MKTNWPTKKLGEVIEFLPKSSRRAGDGLDKGKFPFFTSSPIQKKFLNITDYKEEAIILGTGGSASVHISKNFSTSADVFIIKSSNLNRLENKYLYLFLVANISVLNEGFKGAALKHLSKEYLKNIEIPLPSLSEQKKIVAKLEKILGKISEAKKFRAEAQENTNNLLSTELHKIFEEGKKKGWEEKNLGELFEITSSKRVFKSEWRKFGVPFYRAREVVSLAKNKPFKTPIFISEDMYERYKEKYSVPKAGDILATGVGTLGVTYLVKNGDKFYFKDGNIIWLKKISDIVSEYVEYFFKSDYLKEQVNKYAGGATVRTFTIKTANKIKILLPSLTEQKKIVVRLDKLSQQIEKIKELQTITQNEFIILEQSILSKAFKGEL